MALGIDYSAQEFSFLVTFRGTPQINRLRLGGPGAQDVYIHQPYIDIPASYARYVNKFRI